MRKLNKTLKMYVKIRVLYGLGMMEPIKDSMLVRACVLCIEVSWVKRARVTLVDADMQAATCHQYGPRTRPINTDPLVSLSLWLSGEQG